ncbi:Branched-chain-amino-acid aminotransferase 2 [uncultured Flavonifractor sp.]|mgnify:CR=1 FL=1|uniref:branched-chain amino acid aminotransferase n=1 Tax=Eubacteriales TaxID=186802 RepID=UPI000820B4B7|nr:branched-chain amino acid aminotransferase [Lawsonibacter sp. OA9]MCH1980650.1 branched-chain amino acid aminotransferase [Lawsonibacter sp. OA9]SCH64913.1 Branched-chain-amino-acid aminotransferase 2 [uncultured Clostridium sp.]SCI71779.1 Branched-chain-amino-acid aminotransferase 2 [uncultured Flavonifractor sp.]
MVDIKITRASVLKEKPASSTLVFGKSMTDHMFIVDYDEGQGWHDPRIVPYGPLQIDPAAKVLHYAEEIFEGLKAYRTADGTIQLFRPLDNIARMNKSAERLCLPQIPEELALAGITELVKLERDWVPHEEGTSLYIRPFMIGTDPALGVHSSHHVQYIVIVCPVGAYYPEGLAPVKIYVESEDVRAVKGGTGMAKTGGNYAASLRAGDRAEKQGYSQVLWLDGVHRKYIEEVGAMNVMFKVNGKILTPDLNGSVLDGITRRSCIQLLKDWGYEVEERRISYEELFQAAEDGTLEEAWGTGTAAVVSPIGELAMEGKKVTISGNQIGELTQKLYDNLTGIQWGRLADPHNWIMKL